MNGRRSNALVLRRREAASKDESRGAAFLRLFRCVRLAARRPPLGELHDRPRAEDDDDEAGERQRQHGAVGGVGEDRPDDVGHGGSGGYRWRKSMPGAAERRKRLVGRTAMAYEIIP